MNCIGHYVFVQGYHDDCYSRTAWRIKQLKRNRLTSRLINIQFDRSDVQEMLKIHGNTMVFSLYATFSSSMHCSVKHEVTEFRCCSRLRPVLAGC